MDYRIEAILQVTEQVQYKTAGVGRPQTTQQLQAWKSQLDLERMFLLTH